MMIKQKRTIWLFLVLFLLPFFGVAVLGLTFGQTKDITYIRSSNEMYKLREKPNGDFVITAQKVFINSSLWDPLGTSEKPFSGTIDGSGVDLIFSSDDFKWKTESETAHYGFIAFNRGTIKNINIYVGKEYECSSRQDGNDVFGLLVCKNYGLISNCNTYGAGLLKHHSDDSKSIISPLVGENYGTIYHCKSAIDSKIDATGSIVQFGSICGAFNGGSILQCTATSKTLSLSGTSQYYVGGIVGCLNAESETAIKDCSSLLRISNFSSGVSTIGGVVGLASGEAVMRFVNIYIGISVNCSNGLGQSVSGCCNVQGDSSAIKIENCFSIFATRLSQTEGFQSLNTFLRLRLSNTSLSNCYYSKSLGSDDEGLCKKSSFQDMTFEQLKWDETIWEKGSADYSIR